MQICAYDVRPGDRLMIDGESRRACLVYDWDAVAYWNIEVLFDDGGKIIFNEFEKVVLDNE